MRQIIFGVGAAVLAAGGAALWAGQSSANAADDLAAIQRQFVGHYELVLFQQFPRNSEAIDLDYVGRIMYDGFGNMSAQGMPRDLPTRPREPGERLQGGFAYFGSVSFDLENNIVVHHVEGSPTRGSWVGQDNVRYYEFSDGLLKLSLKDSDGRVTSTLSWRKYSLN